ncbi:MAG: N-formylglutamate amidohydrolase [Gemmatimonadaceae bacterium]
MSSSGAQPVSPHRLAGLAVPGVPLVATAIHAGHDLRPEIARLIALDDAERLREEDPFTDEWTVVAPLRVIGSVSRFEVDVNRPRDGAVYRTPADAWGLRVWKEQLPAGVVERSLARYDTFFASMRELFDAMATQFGRFVVLDIHSYNHRRDGPDAPPADPALNPEVNVGTSNMNRSAWAPVVDRFMNDLALPDANGRRLDVRENVKFRGGHFSQWIHSTYGDAACSLAVEFRKFFMDECTGQPHGNEIDAVRVALESAVPGVLEEVKGL